MATMVALLAARAQKRQNGELMHLLFANSKWQTIVVNLVK